MVPSHTYAYDNNNDVMSVHWYCVFVCRRREVLAVVVYTYSKILYYLIRSIYLDMYLSTPLIR